MEGLLKGEWGRLLERSTEYLTDLHEFIALELEAREKATHGQ